MSYCSFCPGGDQMSSNNVFIPPQQPAPQRNDFLNNAWYHYQSYLYYSNLYNSQYSQTMPSCECYEDMDISRYAYQSSNWSKFPEPNLYSTQYNNDCNEHIDREEGQSFEEEQEEFEVDESFYEFLQQSQKHRKEREKLKKQAEKTDHYIEVGKRTLIASSLPPQEHQEMKRKKDMERLYGDQATSIMSLEASLQLQFDRNFDDRQPVFWPNIPLKF